MKKILIILMLIINASCELDAIKELEKCEPRENVWEGAVIPFMFTENTPEYHRELIYEAIAHYHSNTPLLFKEYTTDEFYSLPHGVLMKFTGDNSVNSSYYPFGQGDYITDLRMGGERWFDLQTAVHELGHVAGLPHEFQIADRDKYIIIHWENIPENWHGNFKLTNIAFETPLSNESVMHYDPTVLAIDRTKPTIEMIDGSEIKVSNFLTKTDIEKINELYCFELHKSPIQ